MWFSRSRRNGSDQLDPAVRREIVQFLREWLPAQAVATYREMIRSNPDGWHLDPHFRDGIVVKRFLRGNGITEAAAGVRDLEPLWPELLRDAVLGEGQDGSSLERAGS